MYGNLPETIIRKRHTAGRLLVCLRWCASLPKYKCCAYRNIVSCCWPLLLVVFCWWCVLGGLLLLVCCWLCVGGGLLLVVSFVLCVGGFC